MIFRELILENFGPYQGKQIIDLTPETGSTTRPIILFGGMNGGGKTTLMDALRLSLYGIRAQCSTRGNLSYPDFLSQCVNRNTPPTEKARIELTFEQVQEDGLAQYKIVRYWEKEPKEGKDTLGILTKSEFQKEWWKDDALTNTWDEYIETLLPLGISNLFLFDGEQVKELAEVETPPDFVVGAIKSLLGLELAERLSVDLDILLTRKRKEAAAAKDIATLDKIEQKFQQIAAEKEIAAEQQGSYGDKLKWTEETLKKATDKFILEGGKIAGDRSRLDAEKKDLTTQAETTRQSLIDLAAGALPLTLITPLLEEAKIQAETEAGQQQAKIAAAAIKQRSNRLLNYINELSIKPDLFEKIQTFIAQENQELEAQAVAEPWLDVDIESLSQLENLLRYELPAFSTAVGKQLQYLKRIETDIDFKDRELAAAASPEAYEKLETAVREAHKEVAYAKAGSEIASRRIEELNRELAKTQKELEKYSDEYIQQKNSQHIITSIAKAQNTLKQFREKLTIQKLTKLENAVTDCFRYLLHKSDLVHRVAIDTNTFSLSLFDPQGQPVPKHRLSAGEKQLLAIALLWGLARVSGRHLPVAIDTPLGRLDSSHRQNLVERYFPSASHQVILLSTDTEVRKVEVEKLRELDAVAREYLLKYDGSERQTKVESGYFW
ncbi:DNA sulfur modification protein DndD [Microcoleus sp. FACHB-68]|uniref:DNA sulfur modification protein DndD n=1 Tax=Microcoleus sp. FACHB-68 TaxID=2692826 RepID=UPI001689723A|nr:DNA sulfur modification protein DndD [Microcoleus sp. FACHB-68]MBD1936326.1 DNA sulfur modification protein DndD [Microcoleus sp. FACHB-68]